MNGSESPDVRVVPDAATLQRIAAEAFAITAEQCVVARGRFMVALSGGSTPKGLYARLASDAALRSRVPWDRTHVFWGDERAVGPEHADSNYRLARETLLDQVPIPPAQIHRMRGEAPDAATAAAEYEEILRVDFGLDSGPALPRFDLVLLGLGPDGHTASLFPGTCALTETRQWVVPNWVGKLYAERITLTAPLINAAERVLFLVAGEDKALPLKGVLEGPFEPQQLPAQLIHPVNGRLEWLVDAAAGRLLATG